MTQHEVVSLIKQADQAITDENFDALMEFYAEDAALIVQPGQTAKGKAQIKKAFEAIAKHFKNALTVTQGQTKVIEGADTALVIMETLLFVGDTRTPVKRRATYVFHNYSSAGWLCTIDNSYGTDLLDAV